MPSYIPICRSRMSSSLTRPSSHTIDNQSLSNQSKSSAQVPTSNDTNNDCRRTHSQQRINPILNNPFLNHRKEQPKINVHINSSNEHHKKNQFYRLPRSLKLNSNIVRVPPIRPIQRTEITNTNKPNTMPALTNNHRTEQDISYVDKTKYDYITRWLNEVREATYSTELVRSTSKRTKRRFESS